jgi:type I restriction enzyme M protein
MTESNHSQTTAFLWSIADLLRGDFKQSQYGRIILPFTLLRRLECVLEPTKKKVLEAAGAADVDRGDRAASAFLAKESLP